MALHPSTRDFLVYLNRHPEIRSRIAAGPDATVLYAGRLIQAAWREILEMRRTLPQLATKKMLPEVLDTIALAGAPHPTLRAWAEALEPLAPWEHNGFIAWRALSGIFAANAVGAVSFVVGSGVHKATKVFAATEVGVLARNPHVDDLTRDMLDYYRRCIAEGRPDLCASLIRA